MKIILDNKYGDEDYAVNLEVVDVSRIEITIGKENYAKVDAQELLAAVQMLIRLDEEES